MPIISRFYGIIIIMYWRDHNPPHFHAKYGENEVEMNIRTGQYLGNMPGRALKMIQDWRTRHIDELLANWTSAQDGTPLLQINPLE